MAAAAARRTVSAPGCSGLAAIVVKFLNHTSFDHLAKVISATGRLPFIEPVLRIVAHLPLKKRPVVNTEEDTRPLALEEELAKLIATPLLECTPSWVGDHQTAYQPGRGIMEVRRGVTMLLEHSKEQGHDVVVYKRDKKNAVGTVDLNGVAFLLSEERVLLSAARWYQEYM